MRSRNLPNEPSEPDLVNHNSAKVPGTLTLAVENGAIQVATDNAYSMGDGELIMLDSLSS